MTEETQCPYCQHEQDVSCETFDGSEDDLHETQCRNCKKIFVYTVVMLFAFRPRKADCLNDAEHNYKATDHFPKECTVMRCTMCNDEREPTDSEWAIINAREK